jgi:hypothetical protein
MSFRFLVFTLRAGNRKRGAFERGKRAILLCKIEFIAFQGMETKRLKKVPFVSYPPGKESLSLTLLLPLMRLPKEFYERRFWIHRPQQRTDKRMRFREVPSFQRR